MSLSGVSYFKWRSPRATRKPDSTPVVLVRVLGPTIRHFKPIGYYLWALSLPQAAATVLGARALGSEGRDLILSIRQWQARDQGGLQDAGFAVSGSMFIWCAPMCTTPASYTLGMRTDHTELCQKKSLHTTPVAAPDRADAAQDTCPSAPDCSGRISATWDGLACVPRRHTPPFPEPRPSATSPRVMSFDSLR
ncbi:hypothetical protein BC628DRAFT_992729 [Trametes gibbosa]|nr:hypothetical protein BC628DRAFT_992729 [Trametes gibbosa]